MYYKGELVEHLVSGYDYGSKVRWVPAIIEGFTNKRIKIRFHLKSGRELIRWCASSTIRKRVKEETSQQ